ncbi:hypothetical protein [Mucisphaera calidilacus]|uniref:PEP-CTERM protein-sorting domain-containing protein n=1 Tax=Mucisphaera calidilacus TaxID=2527982 RepID=A0A518C196_9BACT|nr:hypothetical protein [Mucisphaera calidilacus]QDU72988.1 hypothetical protein Pan265_28660 [Mucisphaera calidilacus]
MKSLSTAACLVAALSASASAQVVFDQVAVIDVTALSAWEPGGGFFDPATPVNPDIYIGSVATVALDGDRLFVGGFDNTGSNSNTTLATAGIIEVTNATTATGIAGGTYGDRFAETVGTVFRGFNDISVQGDTVLAAFDLTGRQSPDSDPRPSFSMWDVSAAAAVAIGDGSNEGVARGVDFDPGYNGAGPDRAAWLAPGSGLTLGVGTHDLATGDVIDALADGVMIVGNGDPVQNPDGFETNRDMEFGANGDVYVRHNNYLDRAVRASDGTIASVNRIDLGVTQGDFVVGQNVAYVAVDNDVDVSNDVILYNDRPESGATGDFTSVVQAVTPDGVAADVTFNWLPDPDNEGGTFEPLSTFAWYDFDFDADTGLLAVLQPTAGVIHMFQIAGDDPGLVGDFNDDGVVNDADIDLLAAAVRTGSSDLLYDLDESGVVDGDDFDVMIGDVLGTLFGDANLDKTVNLLDLSALASNFEATAGWAGGNFNTDTSVDLLDLSVLASNFDQSAPSVPEPVLATLFGLGALAVGRRR